MCIDSQMLSAYLDNELVEPYNTQVREHLEHCAACRKHLESLKAVDEAVKSTAYDEELLLRKKDAIFQVLDKKYFNGRKVNFFRRKIEMSVPAMVTAAAAVVFIFIGGFMLFGTNPRQTDDILPAFAVHANENNVRFVSQTEQSLDSYTLEEILQYLDQKGYQVDISIKGLQPLAEDKQAE